MRVRCAEDERFVSAGCNHYSDEGETRTKVAGYATTHNEEENECADTGEENCGVGIKAHNEGSQNGGPEHGQHMLQAHENGLCPGKSLIRGDNALCFGGPAREVSLS